jgi:hypothetical protein
MNNLYKINVNLFKLNIKNDEDFIIQDKLS